MTANTATETATCLRDVENAPNLSTKKERVKTRGEEGKEELGSRGGKGVSTEFHSRNP